MLVVAIIASTEAAPEWNLSWPTATQLGFFLCFAPDLDVFSGAGHNESDGLFSFTAVRRILHDEVGGHSGNAVFVRAVVNH